MKRTVRSRTTGLRAAVECLPPRTREAMLAAMDEVTFLTGAYTDRDGGVCPMVAAHRRGARTCAHAFARAWDRFTAVKPGEGRPATERELVVLRSLLEASILEEQVRTPLGAAIAEHQSLARARRTREAQDTGLGWLREREPALA